MASHAFHELYYHFTWSTTRRQPLVTDEIQERLVQWIIDEAWKWGGEPLAANVMSDHAHLLVRLPPTVCVSEFIGKVKGSVSFACNHHFRASTYVKWQDGYGVVTLRKSEASRVIRYIENQQILHAERRAYDWLESTEGGEGDWRAGAGTRQQEPGRSRPYGARCVRA